jgi:hypothetical protein
MSQEIERDFHPALWLRRKLHVPDDAVRILPGVEVDGLMGASPLNGLGRVPDEVDVPGGRHYGNGNQKPY